MAISVDLYKKVYQLVQQLDDIDCQALVIMMQGVKAGLSDKDAAEQAALYYISQGLERKAQVMRDTVKEW